MRRPQDGADPAPATPPSSPRSNPVQPAKRQRFQLGEVIATPGALAALTLSGDGYLDLLVRHATGNWGQVSREDAAANEQATLREDDPELRCRVLSSYRTRYGQTVWILTEADRSVTTVLLPEEY